MLRSIPYMLVMLCGGIASAQPAASDDGPGPRVSQPQPAAIGDSTLQALRGRTIAVRRASGGVVVGELVGYDAASFTLALVPSRDIVTLPRGDIAALRLADVAPWTVTPTTASAAAGPSAAGAVVAAGPVRERHFGLQLGLAPGVMLDYEIGYFYAFVHGDVVLPMASSGVLLGFAAGAGVTFALAARSRWKMDVFAHLDPVRLGDVNLGGGIGLGVHFTALNGFTLAFKAPIIGYSGSFGSSSTNNGAGIGVAYYYLGGVMGLPIISLGYRF